MKNASSSFWCLLGAAVLLAACGPGTGETPGADEPLDALEQELVTSCRPTLPTELDPNAPKGLDMVCAGPWEYRSKCYVERANSSSCPRIGYEQKTCSEVASCSYSNRATYSTTGTASGVAYKQQRCDYSRKPPCSYVTTSISYTKTCTQVANDVMASLRAEGREDPKYPLYVVSNTVGPRVYANAIEDFDFDSTAATTSFTESCSITLGNVVQNWAYGQHTDCGLRYWQCDDTTRPLYTTCRHPDHGMENDPARCDGLVGYGLKYSPPAISQNQLTLLHDVTADTRAENYPNRPRCMTAEETAFSNVEAKYTKLATQFDAAVPTGVDGPQLKFHLVNALKLLFERHGNSPALDSTVQAGTYANRRERIRALYTSHPEVNRVTRVDPGIDFDWGLGAPASSLAPETFSARWTGVVDVPVAGNYTFHAQTDDGFRLWVDGVLVIDTWVDQVPTWHQVTRSLSVGRHALKVEYFEKGGGAVARLYWTTPDTAMQPIPVSRLFLSPTSTVNGLLAEYFDNINLTSDACGTFQPPQRDDACTGARELNTTLAMCHRMTQGHVPASVSSLVLNTCIDASAKLSTVACGQTNYRQLWSTLTLSLLKKSLEAKHAVDASEEASLQKKLAWMDRWYRASRAHVHGKNALAEALNRDVSDAVGAFWRGAYSSRQDIRIKPAVGETPPALSSSELPGLSSNYLAVDRAVLKAAFTPVSGTTSTFALTSAPLLMVMTDALRGMSQRLSAVSATHDLACRFRECQANLLTSEVSELWRLLGSIPVDPSAADPENKWLSLTEALTTSPKVRQHWRDVFVWLEGKHHVLRGAVVDALSPAGTASVTYTSDLLAGTALERLPLPAVELAKLLRDARYRAENYAKTGRFEAVARNVLHTGMNREKELEVDAEVNTRFDALTTTITNYRSGREALVNSLVTEMRNTQTTESLNSQLLQKLQRTRQLGRDLDGLRDLARIDAARQAEFVKGFNTVASLPQVQEFQVTRQPEVTVPVKARDAKYTALVPNASDSMANLSTGWTRSASAGDVLHIQVSGLWGPTCAMRVKQLTLPYQAYDTANLVNVTNAVLTGPEGFLLTLSNNTYSQQSIATVSENGTYASVSAGESLCAGVHVEAGTPGIAETFGGVSAKVYADASRCIRTDLGARTSETTSNNNSSGSERSTAAAFSAGLRLPNTPFPNLPAGSLLLVEVEKGLPYRQNIKQVHVLQRPSNTVLVSGERDLYLVVNDKGGCTDVSDSPLTLTVNHVQRLGASTGPKAQSLLQAMADARKVIEDATPGFLAAGRVSPQDLAALRERAYLKLQTAFPNADQLPSHLRGLFNAWVEHDSAALVRQLEMLAVERELVLLEMELKALKDDLARTAGEARLLRLLPVWSLRNLEAVRLETATLDLARGVSDYLFPTIHLRYTDVFAHLTQDADAKKALLALTDGDTTLGATWDGSFLAVAEQLQALINRVRVHLGTERSEANLVPLTAEFPILAISFPRPGYPQPADTFPEWRVADEARSREVWDAIQDPARETVSFTVRPEDLYHYNGGSSMPCNQGAMVVRSMALYISRRYQPDGDSLTEYYRMVPAKVDPSMSFITKRGVETYQQLNTDWLQSFVYPVFGEPGEVITQFKSYAKAYRKGNGLSPFGRFDFDFVALRSWWPKPLDSADQVLLVFEVETQSLGFTMNWVETCRKPQTTTSGTTALLP